MGISGLGSINTLILREEKRAAAGKGSAGFSALFTGVMASTAESTESISVTEEKDEFSSEELAGLYQFLQMNDILDLENGLDLLEKTAFKSDEDIIRATVEQLGLSTEELLQVLKGFYSKMTSSDEKVLGSETLTQVEGEKSQIEEILTIIDAIASIQIQKVSVIPDKEFGETMKALKLFDLLSANKDLFGNETRLKEFIKNINEILELKMNGQAQTNRDGFLQKTFNNLVKELNMKHPNQSAGNETNSENLAKVLNKTEGINPSFIQFQQLSKPEQLTLLTNQQRPVSADQLIEQFESILARSKFTNNGGTQRLFIKLNPEHLGALRVELIQKDSAIIARILTSTTVAKDMMESHLNGLKQAFSTQNIQVEKIEIAQQFTSQERTFNREQQQGQDRQQNQSKEEQKELQTTDDFNHSFEEALLNIEA